MPPAENSNSEPEHPRKSTTDLDLEANKRAEELYDDLFQLRMEIFMAITGLYQRSSMSNEKIPLLVTKITRWLTDLSVSNDYIVNWEAFLENYDYKKLWQEVATLVEGFENLEQLQVLQSILNERDPETYEVREIEEWLYVEYCDVSSTKEIRWFAKEIGMRNPDEIAKAQAELKAVLDNSQENTGLRDRISNIFRVVSDFCRDIGSVPNEQKKERAHIRQILLKMIQKLFFLLKKEVAMLSLIEEPRQRLQIRVCELEQEVMEARSLSGFQNTIKKLSVLHEGMKEFDLTEAPKIKETLFSNIDLRFFERKALYALNEEQLRGAIIHLRSLLGDILLKKEQIGCPELLEDIEGIIKRRLEDATKLRKQRNLGK